jgi:predicted secreted protein
MLNRIAAGLIVAATTLLPSSLSFAADAAALAVLGFSPDGRHFGFMQYGPRWDALEFHAEVFVVDTGRDRFVQGVPLRVSAEMKDDANEDNIGPQLKAFLATVRKRTASLVRTHKISKPGARLASAAEARAGEHSSGSDMPEAGAGVAAVTARHPVLGDLTLRLDIKPMEWPKTSRYNSHKDATSCAEEMAPAKGAAFRLTLERRGQSILLHDDKTIPASRHCASGYGIVEVHAFDRPDGKVTLAVILGMRSRGFEGADRTFLAVTRVLER